jgi:cell division topological specificity factor
MSIWDKLFSGDSKQSASIAKKRLQIIIAKNDNSNPILNVIEEDVIEAIKKYVKVDLDNIETNIENEGLDILSVNAGLENNAGDKEKLSLLDMIFSKKNKSASIAKERLRIVISKDNSAPDFCDNLESDVRDIIKRHVSKGTDKVQIFMDKDQDGNETLEININLPDEISSMQ